MWWEITRVSYDLQTGVITRQPTINVKKKKSVTCTEVFSINHHQPLKCALPSINVTVFLPDDKASAKRVYVGFPSATSQLKAPET